MVRKVTKSALIAALYVALTLGMAPISFGILQIRVSDALILTSKKGKEYIIGVTLGAAIANFFSPLGVIDVAVGLASNLLAGIVILKVRRKFVSIPMASAIIASIVGLELSIFYQVPVFLSIGSTFIAEIIVLIVADIAILGVKKGGKAIEARKTS